MRKQLSEDLADISSDTFYLFIFLQNSKPIAKKFVLLLFFFSFLPSFIFACDCNFQYEPRYFSVCRKETCNNAMVLIKLSSLLPCRISISIQLSSDYHFAEQMSTASRCDDGAER